MHERKPNVHSPVDFAVDGVIEAVPDCLLEAQMPLWQVYPLLFWKRLLQDPPSLVGVCMHSSLTQEAVVQPFPFPTHSPNHPHAPDEKLTGVGVCSVAGGSGSAPV